MNYNSIEVYDAASRNKNLHTVYMSTKSFKIALFDIFMLSLYQAQPINYIFIQIKTDKNDHFVNNLWANDEFVSFR